LIANKRGKLLHPQKYCYFLKFFFVIVHYFY